MSIEERDSKSTAKMLLNGDDFITTIYIGEEIVDEKQCRMSDLTNSTANVRWLLECLARSFSK
jgi:hypothetical protein